MFMYKAIILDLDDTLYEYEALNRQAVAAMCLPRSLTAHFPKLGRIQKIFWEKRVRAIIECYTVSGLWKIWEKSPLLLL